MTSTSPSKEDSENGEMNQYMEVFKTYFENEKSLPSLRGFYEANEQYVLNNSNFKSVVATWKRRFKVAMQNFNVKDSSKAQPDWADILQRLMDMNNQSQSPADDTSSNILSTPSTSELKSPQKRSRSTSQSSKTDSLPLTVEARKLFEDRFNKMEDTEKWRLSDDKNGQPRYLENIMYAFGSECEYEHLVHSFVFDINATWWKENDRLSDQDVEQIMSAGNPSLPELDPSLQAIFDDCKSAVSSIGLGVSQDDLTIDALWESVTSHGFFNPRTHPEHEWLQRIMLDFLAMYRNRTLGNLLACGSEQDFIIRCWSNIDKCFEDVAVAGRDRSCVSTLARVNSDREVTGVKPIDEQKPSVRPDLLLSKDNVELGCGECGKDDTAGVSKKEIVERRLHVPKIMKDIFCRALSDGGESLSLAREIRIVALNQNSTRMELAVLDCPKGYTCRLLTTDDCQIPQDPKLITSDLFPVLQLGLIAKVIIKETQASLARHKKELNKKPKFAHQKASYPVIQIPPSFTLVNKKQKTSK